jgi:endonuclease YncB( thermonuclease family)
MRGLSSFTFPAAGRLTANVLALAVGFAFLPPLATRGLAQAPATRPRTEGSERPGRQTRPDEPRPEPKPQPRPSGQRVAVDPARIEVDDGDSVLIRWSRSEAETVRILGIDTPETRHLEHDIPYAQAFGPEARAFAAGAFGAAERVELLRASTLDPYGRTLGYLFIDGRNYSVLAVRARFAQESVTFYGDNGLPREAAEVLEAAKTAGPLPFEPPHVYRGRMRELSRWMKERGLYPEE